MYCYYHRLHMPTSFVSDLTPSHSLMYRFGESPCTVNCPTCHNEVNTRVGYEAGTFTWLLVLVIFLLGLAFPILWL